MIWAMLVSMALITFFNRYLFFTESILYSPGPKLRRFLSYSSYSILTAIWAPIVFHFDNQGTIEIAGLDYLLASSVAAILSFLRVTSIAVVLVSSAVFFLIRFY